MTTDLTAPAVPAAPIPTAAPAAIGSAAAPLDLRPGAVPPAGVAAAMEAVNYTGTVTLLDHTYTLRPKIPAQAMIDLQDAQSEQDYGKLAAVFPRIIHSTQVEAYRAQLALDTDDENLIVGLDDLLTALGQGLEQIGARPTEK